MKKLLAILSGLAGISLMLCLPTYRSHAQASLNVKGGIGITSLHNTAGNAPSGASYSAGYSLPYALGCNWPLSSSFSIYTEVGYQQLGGITNDIHPIQQPGGNSFKQPALYADCLSETHLHYLSTALMVRYRYPVDKVRCFYIQTGIAPQLLLNAEQVDKGYGMVYTYADSYLPVSDNYFRDKWSTRSHFYNWNWTVAGAAGLCWKIDRETVMVELRVNQGIRRVENEVRYGAHTTGFYYAMIGYGIDL